MSPAFTFLVPNNPMLVGASLDVQGADMDGGGLITLTDNDLEIEAASPPPASANMVAIPAGTFLMGSPPGSLVVVPEEQPAHLVTITRPFWIGKYEVTQAEYQAVMGSNPSYHQGASYPNSASRPVEQVSWYDAVLYCSLLTMQEDAAGRLATGYEYRLPTEAEWEYCCRAGTTTDWNVGNFLTCVEANFDQCVGQTSTVGSYPANPWGLHDTHGNVWEWCFDSWDFSANYPAGPVSDPFVNFLSSGPFLVFRGGSWPSFFINTRSAYRFGYFPSYAWSDLGFRVVCAPILNVPAR